MKEALIVDPEKGLGNFAQEALAHYNWTAVDTLQEAEALACGAEYQLVLIAHHDNRCTGGLWMMVERIRRQAATPALIIVETDEADVAFHARAAELGVTVLTAPLDATAYALFDQVTAG